VLVTVVPADALQRQIEAVPDRPIESTRTADRHLAIDLVAGPDHHPADREADAIELFGIRFRDLVEDHRLQVLSGALENLRITASLDKPSLPNRERGSTSSERGAGRRPEW
jgi:hypothetical protein